MSDLSSYINRTKVSETSDAVLVEKTDPVLLRICEQGISFPSELSRDVDLRVDDVNKIIYFLKRNGFIDKIHPDADCSAPQFRGRVHELNQKGMVTLGMFAQFSWWTLTISGFEYLKTKYNGQGKRIKGSLVMALGLEKEEVHDETPTPL